MAHEWIHYLVSDAQVNAQAPGLSIYDLYQLHDDQGWMTDSLIHYIVTRHAGLLGSERNHVLWIEPAIVKAGKDGLVGDFGATLGGALGGARHLDLVANALPGNGARTVLFPVNRSDSHWSLLALHDEGENEARLRRFVHYDSMSPSNDPAAVALIDRLGECGYLSRRDVPFVNHVDVFPQADGFNCGLYVAQFARKSLEVGRALAQGEVQAITSGTSDTLRGQVLTALEPLFPAAPMGGGAPPVVVGQARKYEGTERQPAPARDKKDALTNGFWDTKSGRKSKIRTALLLATGNDEPFTKCFMKTHPTARKLITGQSTGSLSALVQEGVVLRRIMGGSKTVLSTVKDKKNEFVSKYSTWAQKNGFTLNPERRPRPHVPVKPTDPTNVDRAANAGGDAITGQGFQLSFFQFLRQELHPILGHYEKNVPDLNHNHQHIVRSLILGQAMAVFYLEHGQPRFLPGDTRPPKSREKRPFVNPDCWREALAAMPVPAVHEVDPATIALGIGFHDCARAAGGKDVWEHESARNAFYYLLDLGYSSEYSAYVASMIVKNETNEEDRKGKGPPPTSKPSEPSKKKPVVVSRQDGTSVTKPKNSTRNLKPKEEEPHEEDLNEQIIHDADTLEIHRLLHGRYGEGSKFDKKRLKFLTDKKLSQARLGKEAEAYRDELIADAHLLAGLSTGVATEAGKGEDGVPAGKGRVHFETILAGARAALKKNGGDEELAFRCYFAAHESLVIESIIAKPRSFPFLYRYYFRGCFDPKDDQLARLAPEERVALIRARVNTIERLQRDHELALLGMEKLNDKAEGAIPKEKTAYTVDQFAKDLVQLPLTINLPSKGGGSLDEVIEAIGPLDKDPKSTELQQFWEVFWKTGKPRSGASNDPKTRDPAEMNNVQYWLIPCEMDAGSGKDRIVFERRRRPKYTAVNLARTAGACPKYGDCAYVLRPHVWRRVTLTHNDTFNVGVRPDDLCTPMHPYALLKKVTDDRFKLDHLALYAAGKGGEGDKWAAKFRGFAQGGASIPYIEAHVHGPVSWAEDVAEIVVRLPTATPKPTTTGPTPSTAPTTTPEAPYDWAAWDQRVTAFAARWATEAHPDGILVRYMRTDGFERYRTRADALGKLNPIGEKGPTVSGKLDKPVELARPKPKPKTTTSSTSVIS